MKKQTPRIWNFPDLLLREYVRRYDTRMLAVRPTPELAVHTIGVLSDIPDDDQRRQRLQAYMQMLMNPKPGRPSKDDPQYIQLAIPVYRWLEEIRDCGISKEHAIELLKRDQTKLGFRSGQLPGIKGIEAHAQTACQYLGDSPRSPLLRRSKAEIDAVVSRLADSSD